MTDKIYCKHCGKLIDADSSFCMHCGGAINSNNKTTPQANKQDVSFIRQLDILGGKFIIGILNIIKWCGRTIINFGKFIKRHWKRILIFILGIAGAILLIYLGVEEVKEYLAMFIIPAIILTILTLYFSCSKSIKLILPSSILLLCSYGAFIYHDREYIYGANTTFFDIVKREFYWITPNYTIPNSVTSIGEHAFNGCTSLISVTIPDSVTEIGEWAFASCTSLTSITIPDSVTEIGDSAFYKCTSLTSITIPDSVTEIGEWAFASCTSLTSITIPDSDAEIGDSAFYKCTSLTSITIPDSVTSIGKNAFYECTSLTSVTIPDSVTEIGEKAFADCSRLTSITIPDSVTEIGWMAFYDCHRLTSVYCKATTPPTGGYGVFSEDDYPCEHIGCKIYVPRNSVEAYKSADGWKEYADYIEGHDF